MHPWPENCTGAGESFPGTTHPSSPQDDVDTHHPVNALSDFATAQRLFSPSKLISHLWGDPLKAWHILVLVTLPSPDLVSKDDSWPMALIRQVSNTALPPSTFPVGPCHFSVNEKPPFLLFIDLPICYWYRLLDSCFFNGLEFTIWCSNGPRRKLLLHFEIHLFAFKTIYVC